MLKYDIAQLHASARGRPDGFVNFVLQHGKIDGGFVFLSETLQQKLSQRFPPAKFNIVQLKTDVKQLRGICFFGVDWVWRRGLRGRTDRLR
jgi:hypothetical protein